MFTHSKTLWLKVWILTMWSLQPYPFSHSECQGLHPACFPLWLQYFVCCPDMLSYLTELIHILFIELLAITTEPHEIRFAASPVDAAPSSSGCYNSFCSLRVWPLSHCLCPVQTRSCKRCYLSSVSCDPHLVGVSKQLRSASSQAASEEHSSHREAEVWPVQQFSKLYFSETMQSYSHSIKLNGV